MLALVIARPGPICDGLVALLGAAPDVRSIVRIPQAMDAWEFVQLVNPDITLVNATPLTPEFASIIFQIKQSCHSPLLAIVDSDADRQTATAQGADVVVTEGLPSVKLAAHITTLLRQYSKTKAVEFSRQNS